eukprot:symbB.v1.2.009747.t1/scaffold607.1/size181925/2
MQKVLQGPGHISRCFRKGFGTLLRSVQKRRSSRLRQLQAQRSALLSLLKEEVGPGDKNATLMALEELKDLEVPLEKDLVPVLQGLASKTLWQSALELFHEEMSDTNVGPSFGRVKSEVSIPLAGATNAMLKGCQKAGQWEVCFSLLSHAVACRWCLNVRSFNAAINACQEGSAWRPALQLLEMLKMQGLTATDVSLSSSIAACGLAAQWQRSMAILLAANRPSMVSYGGVLAACSRGEAWQQALCLFHHMQREGLKPNVICSNALLNAFAQSSEWFKALIHLQYMRSTGETTVISFNTVLNALRHSWLQSILLLSEMEEMSMANESSYNTCIAALGAALQWSHAIQLMEHPGARRIEKRGAVLGSLARAAQWREALCILEGIKEPEILCYNAAMRACERAHEWQRVLMLFQQVEAHQHSSASYCTMCTALSRAYHWQESLKLMLVAWDRNLASRPVMGAAIFGAAEATAWEAAMVIFASMRDASIEPDDTIRNCLLPILPADQAKTLLRGDKKSATLQRQSWCNWKHWDVPN